MTIVKILRELHTPGSTMQFQVSEYYFRNGRNLLPAVYDSAAREPYPMVFPNGTGWLDLNYNVTELYKGL